MNKNVKNWGVGLGVAGISVASSTGILSSLGGCTGSCASCGGACVVPLVGIGTIGVISIFSKKFKDKKKYLETTKKY
ncbi:MAG TPA: hypothetical protein VF941_05560 [Clostridia bacterium]